MEQKTDYLQPDLIGVDLRPDLRRSPRFAPADLHVEMYSGWSSHPRDCHCLNISLHGLALICDLPGATVGDPVLLNLWSGQRTESGITGHIVRTDVTERFTRLAVSFDRPLPMGLISCL